MIYKLDIYTSKSQDMIDITENIYEVVKKSNVKNGVCFIYSPHTTCGITINEGADHDVKRDIISKLNEIIPVNDPSYTHMEGNSHSHIKTSIFSNDVFVFIENGEILLGRWQAIYLCEFDGPRKRNIWVKILSEDKI